jgi:glycosyltransferase involved in cell wall biosynthesis
MAKSAFILGHTNGRIIGNLGILQDYLKTKGYKITLLLHPLDSSESIPTTLTTDGQEVIIPRHPHGIASFIGDLFLSLKLLKASDPSVFIGTTNFDTLPAIIRRQWFGQRIPYILYYPRDYAEDRYSSRILNLIYRWVEQVAVRYADATISYTSRAEAKRLGHGLSRNRSFVIPNIVSIANPTFTKKDIRKDHFVYSGDVNAEHGLYELIQTISPLINKLVIIGSGPDWDRTISLAKDLGLHLEIHHDKSREFAVEYLRDFNGVGLAPYKLAKKWPYYSSPLKIPEYVASGVPVLMSSVPEIAAIVSNQKLGVVYEELGLEAIRKQLDALDTNSFEARAQEFYEAHTVEHLLDPVFDNLPYKMKIAVNSRLYQIKNTGIPYYIKMLYREYLGAYRQDDIIFLQTDTTKTIGKTVTMNHTPFGHSRPMFDLVWTSLLVRDQKDVTIFHGAASILPFFKNRRVKYVVTVHDLAFELFPGDYGKLFNLYYHWSVLRSVKRADIVVAVSMNTKRDLVSKYQVDEHKVEVIYHGVNDFFVRHDTSPRLIAARYFLSITTHPKRKNVVGVLKAMAVGTAFVQSLTYVIAGVMDSDQLHQLRDLIAELGLAGKVDLFGYATESQLRNLYAHAEFFIYPSFYEGFGLPVLEAMVSRCPVITSSASSLPELVPDTEWLVDPSDINEISRKMSQLLSLSKVKRAALINKNHDFAKQFTWDRAASQMHSIFMKLGGYAN